MADPVNLTPEQIKAIAEGYNELTKKANKTSDAFASLGQSNVDLIQKFAGLSKATNSVVDQTENLITAIGELTSEAGIANTLNLAADKMLKNSQELANSLDQARASYVKGSGDIIEYGDNMNNIMYEASMNVTKFGTDVGPAGLAVRSAFSGISMEVNNLNKAQQSNYSSVLTTVNQLELLGVSAQTSTNAIRVMANTMSTGGVMTVDTMKAAADSVAKTTLELSKMGYSLSDSAAMFEKNSDLVTDFGEDALKSLAAISAQTRIEMSSLVDVANKFDTFETAAIHVGKLNALLGSDYLSVTEMMFAEPAEKVKMISTAFEDAGVSVDNMSESEKKYTLITIQNTLGLKNRQEALNFLNADEFGRAAQLEQQAENQLKNVDSQERLNKLINESVPVMEKLANAFKNIFSILEPVFTTINKYLSLFADDMNKVGDETKNFDYWTKLIVGTISIATISMTSYALTIVTKTLAMNAANAASGALGRGLANLGGAANTAAGGLAPAANGANNLGKTAGGAWKNTLALGAAILMIGVGIGAAAYGVSYLAASFKGLGDAAWPAAYAIGAFSAAFVLLILVLGSTVAGPQAALTAAAVLVLLSVGAAAMMIGAGVEYAASGMAELVKAFSVLLVAASPSASAINDFTAAMARLVLLLFAMGSGPQAIAIGIGIALLAGIGVAASSIGNSMKMATEGIQSFASIVSQLGQLEGVVSLMKTLSDSIDSIGNKEIKINVEVVGDLEALKAISNITTVAAGTAAGNTTNQGSAPTATTTQLAQPKIEIREVVIRFDDQNGFRGYVEDIIYDTLLSNGVVTN
jgi:hypothetical protein